MLGLYALQRFDAGTTEVGVIFAVLGLLTAIGQGVLVGPATKPFGEARVIEAGLLASASGLLVAMIADGYVALVVTIGLFALCSAPLIPALTSLTSKRAELSQGVTMGVSNSFISLGRIVGPLLGGLVFDIDLALPFATGAVVMLLGFFVALRWLSARDEGDPAETTLAALMEHSDR